MQHPSSSFRSDAHSPHTQTTTTSQVIHECPAQGEVDNILSGELKFVTYEGDWVAKHFCLARAEMVEQIIERLRKADIWKCSTPKALNISEMRDWPGEASAGPAFCGPFTTLLNTIVEAFAACYPSEFKRSYNRDVIFKQYTETVQEAGEYVLRPSILALSKLLLNKGRASWYATVFAGEVNCCWGRLVLQAGAYARCLFAASDHRVFIPIMALHHSTSTFRLLFYHRSGVLASHAMALRTVSGFNDFVSTVVGMWLWQEPSQAGYVPTQLPRYHSFNGIKFFVHCILCRRQAIRGRATTVYLVDCEELPEDLARYHAVPQVECGRREWECLNPFDYHDQQPEGLAELEDDNNEEGDEADVEAESQEDTVTTQELVLTDPLPEYFIVKCSHQPLGQTTELEVFRDVQGFIGIPDIIAEYDALCFVIPADKTPSPWKVFIDREEDILPYEPRVHKHTIIASIGHRLTEIMTFQQVGYALLHAMIGHCALFTEGGYLHRDVSIGNIVHLFGDPPRSDWKIPPLLHGIVTSGECSAVLIDGDVAKKWGTPPQALDRPGTLPFTSANLVDSWAKKKAVIHTPVDDLESFVWVLLYDALAWTPASERTGVERRWWEDINSETLHSLATFKRLLLVVDLGSRAGELEEDLSGILSIFKPLIHAWFLMANEFAAAHKQLLRKQGDENGFTQLYHDAYKAFISVGLERCAALPDTPIKSVYEE
ncbi:hypothetical protein EYR36_012021 [Pleurotus pulmonarius]|nr:hypothetical protein EYR36_012021 [Pleurotus pulmonarius]